MNDRFNNHVTYDLRWETKRAETYLNKLENKYYDRSVCQPSCPHAWAEEVYNLLEYLNKEFGIEYNTSTIRGYRFSDHNIVKGLLYDPFINPFKDFYNYFIMPRLQPKDDFFKQFYGDRSVANKIKLIIEGAFHPIYYSLRCFKFRYVHRMYNFLLKPKITLDQVKEKYGYLTIYFTAPEYLEEHIREKIRETEMLLAKKGAYYTPENFYFTKQSYKEYPYREILKKLGFNMDSIALLAEEKRALNDKKNKISKKNSKI